MYCYNYNPNKDNFYTIKLEPDGKFYQLIGDGIVAESDSWRRLKKYAEENKLKLNKLYPSNK